MKRAKWLRRQRRIRSRTLAGRTFSRDVAWDAGREVSMTYDSRTGRVTIKGARRGNGTFGTHRSALELWTFES